MARPIHPQVDIGHVHLKVADLDRAIAFYNGVLGFDVTQRMPGAAFLSAGGYHHHIGLNTWDSSRRHGTGPGTTGLYHLAIRYPTRAALGDALRRLAEARSDARRRERPRRERSALPPRSGRQRRRVVLGPPEETLAARRRRHDSDGDRAARSTLAANGCRGRQLGLDGCRSAASTLSQRDARSAARPSRPTARPPQGPARRCAGGV